LQARAKKSLLLGSLGGFQGPPHPGNTFPGRFNYFRIVLLKREFQGVCAPFSVYGGTCAVEHFEADELVVVKAALPVVLNGYAPARVNAAGNSNSLLLKINPFVKIWIVLPTGEYRNWSPISVSQLLLRVPEPGKRRSGKSNG
jgi:hypothetical protein